ncbi:GntR family transcriptional regulator [Intrasporangium sp.]|uniref:GntR family transcriptional regulator n=1 Tax=Intrasporangium sp. TaxID=1925024 RepID=UPI00322210C9
MSNDGLAAALQHLGHLAAAPSASERVADVLRRQIVDGAIRSGTRLTEETISARIGFSRNTIREAFGVLVAERLAVREPNRGVFVATPSRADVTDLYATRQLVEPAAVEYGPGCSPAAVAELRAIVEQAREGRDGGHPEVVAEANQHFHLALTRIGRSARAEQLMRGVLTEMRLVFHLMDDDARFHEPYLERNARIVDLLERGRRAEAAATLREYLADAERQLLAAIDAGGGDGGRSS